MPRPGLGRDFHQQGTLGGARPAIFGLDQDPTSKRQQLMRATANWRKWAERLGLI